MVKERYQEIQKAISDIKWKHSWMVKTIVYRKGTEKEPLRNLNKKINLPLFALERLFLMSAQHFFETFTIKLYSAKAKQRCLFISRESQATLCPGWALSSLQLLRWQIHLLTLDNGIAQDKEPRQQHANPIWIWGTWRDIVKIFTAKGLKLHLSYSFLY